MNLFKSLETVCCCCFSLPFLIVKFRSLFNLEPSKTTIKVKKKNVSALFTSLHIVSLHYVVESHCVDVLIT